MEALFTEFGKCEVDSLLRNGAPMWTDGLRRGVSRGGGGLQSCKRGHLIDEASVTHAHGFQVTKSGQGDRVAATAGAEHLRREYNELK